MSDMPMRGEISISAEHWEQAQWSPSVATLMNRDLLGVISFCLVGLLLTMLFLRSFADLYALVGSLV
jgi:hypothetical protein